VTSDERFEAGLRVRDELGYEPGKPEFLDDDFFRHTTTNLFGTVFTRPGLSLRDREMITLAVIIAGGGTFENMYPHFRAVKKLGLSDTEIKELIIQTMYYAGWPKGANAAKIYKQIKEREAAET
jgi:4-carboxymuconolactone decarboxylase